MRDKMRSLDTNIKADFINKNQAEGDSSAGSASSQRRYFGFGSHSRTKSKDSSNEDASQKKSSKSRPLSGGFASKMESTPFKKLKSDSSHPQKRPKSVDMSQSNSSRGLAPVASNTGLSVTATQEAATDPTDFVHYLKEVQRPEIVEVGKLHKLRLLLRNETVAWVNAFVSNGGMDELVALLYRILKVEWRYVLPWSLLI